MMDNINTEAIYYSARYSTSGGWKITLAVPDDLVPKQLDAIGAGKRFMLALVPIGDDEQPEPVKPAQNPLKGGRLAQRAGMICSQPAFHAFINVSSQDEAAEFVRKACGITSRAEIDHSPEARAKFEALLTDYELDSGYYG